MIKTIFLDLDGVITDFVGGVCRAFNKPNPYPSLTQDYTFWNAWPEISIKKVDTVCTIDFWANLNWAHGGHDILRMVLDHFKPEQVYLVTRPMPNPGSYTGKAFWVQKHLPKYSKRLIITQAPKSLLAKPDTLLIDDKDENVDEFVKAGGKAILVPRPWNELHGWADETYQVVKNSLGNLKC